MQGHSLVARAAEPFATTVRAIRADQLGAATPCPEYDVRRLLNHLLYWGPSLVGAATDTLVPPPAGSEQEADLTGDAAGGGWAEALAAQAERLVTAWREPDAWQGTTRIAGPDPLPASMIGGMVLTELVVHAWDLARATGQRPEWDDRVLDFVHQEVIKTAEQGRAMGAYGPPVPVRRDAPVLDQILGLTGRDPHRQP